MVLLAWCYSQYLELTVLSSMPLASWQPFQMLFLALAIQDSSFLVHTSTFWLYFCSSSSVMRPNYRLFYRALSSCYFFLSRLWRRCCRALEMVSRLSILSYSFSSLYSSRKEATSSSSDSFQGRSLFSEYLTVKSSSSTGGFSSECSGGGWFLLRSRNQYTSCRTAWMSVWLLPMFFRMKSKRYPHFSIYCLSCYCLSMFGRILPISEERQGRILSSDYRDKAIYGDFVQVACASITLRRIYCTWWFLKSLPSSCRIQLCRTSFIFFLCCCRVCTSSSSSSCPSTDCSSSSQASLCSSIQQLSFCSQCRYCCMKFSMMRVVSPKAARLTASPFLSVLAAFRSQQAISSMNSRSCSVFMWIRSRFLEQQCISPYSASLWRIEFVIDFRLFSFQTIQGPLQIPRYDRQPGFFFGAFLRLVIGLETLRLWVWQGDFPNDLLLSSLYTILWMMLFRLFCTVFLSDLLQNVLGLGSPNDFLYASTKYLLLLFFFWRLSCSCLREGGTRR